MYDRLVWKRDRMILGNLVFRLEHCKSDEWELGEECFVFYKTRPLVEQYRKWWASIPRFTAKNILELGVWDGGSVAFWFEQFKPVKHVGVDIQAKQESEYFRRYVEERGLEDRIRIYWNTDQADNGKIGEIVAREFRGPLDLVIDDASHLYGPTKASFELLFPLLRPGGLYIIEDWAWGHWKEFQSPEHPWSRETPLSALVKELIEATGTAKGTQSSPDSAILANLAVFQGFAVVERGKAIVGERDVFRLEELISRRPQDGKGARPISAIDQSDSAFESVPDEGGPIQRFVPAVNRQSFRHRDTSERPPRLIAFYLPQYHPIPENDEWWGKGFTEWSNVVKAQPLFEGHDQPQLPSELGFYDLRLPEVRQAQADLAREHGIRAFCYYHYWFNGKHLLEKPFNEVLDSGRPDFPFCLCWANENWTRAWDGLDHDLLIEQRWSPEDDLRHIRWLANAFRDRRYVRIDGKPVFLVYRISKLPDPRRTSTIWREEAYKLGIGEIYLCTVESLRDDRAEPASVGFDAAVEFQPDWLNLPPPLFRTPENNAVYDYSMLVDRMLQRTLPRYKRFPCVTPAWDNTARRRRDVTVLRDSTPERYQEWLEKVIERTMQSDGEENLIFLNAWNEWAEGAFLEPSQKWGRAYLKATATALENVRDRSPRPVASIQSIVPTSSHSFRASVCIPTYNGAKYLDATIRSVLNQTLADYELVVVDDCSVDATEEIVRSFSDRRISFHKNPSRLGLGGNWTRCTELARGRYVCIFHQDDEMLPENLAEKVGVLEGNPSVGMVHSRVYQIGPQDEIISDCWYFKPNPEEGVVQPGLSYFERLLQGVNVVCCPSAVVRRECYETLGGFDTRLPFTADWEMWMRIALFYDIAYLPEPLVKYRRHDGMETSNFLGVKELEHAYQAKKIVLEKYPERVRDARELQLKMTRMYEELGLDRAAEAHRLGHHSAARDYLTFAVSLHGMLDEGVSRKAHADWFIEAIDRIWQQEASASPTHVVPPAVSPAPLAPDSLQPAPTDRFDCRLFLNDMRSSDIAQLIPLRTAVKILAHEVAAIRGLRWLRLFAWPAKKVLG